jgi:hypothetical protein
LSLDGSAAQHPNWSLYDMLSRGAGDVRSRIDVRPMPVVSVRPAVSQVPAPAGHRVRRVPFEGRVLGDGGVWRSPTASPAALRCRASHAIGVRRRERRARERVGESEGDSGGGVAVRASARARVGESEGRQPLG